MEVQDHTFTFKVTGTVTIRASSPEEAQEMAYEYLLYIPKPGDAACKDLNIYDVDELVHTETTQIEHLYHHCIRCDNRYTPYLKGPDTGFCLYCLMAHAIYADDTAHCFLCIKCHNRKCTGRCPLVSIPLADFACTCEKSEPRKSL